ncbi:MAG: regulatory protein RecX [Pyrinomonadaceae bacterium]|nr:RecX family transcriptional regulator [Acidobacteriota bacterium]MDQ3490608.1 RecX family transcriptional regulator [Acidobacteriota bacterium]
MWRKRSDFDQVRERIINDADKSRERTMNRAVKLLSAKPRSIGELRERLLEKVWTNEEIVNSVIEKLKEYKYLDDQQFARSLALSKLRQKPQGKRRLQQALSRKQLDKEIVDEAIVSAFEKMPEGNLINLAIEKRLRLKGRPETREDKKKFYDHLLRQGFSYDLIRSRMAEISKGELEQDLRNE